MLRPRALRLAAFSVAALLVIGVQIGTAASASAHTCSSNWCSGSDGGTTYNVQGHNDQIYVGEVGIYCADLGNLCSPSCPGDPGGFCFNTTAANGASSRWSAGTGIGVQFYYLGGGADSELEGNYSSPYCFGWHQAVDAENQISSYFSSYFYQAYFVFLDIEQNGTFGWSNTAQSANRQVFNGFWDNIAGKAPAQDCSGSTTGGYQPATYSAPAQWSYSFGSYGSIPNTPIWTYEYCCSGSWPGSYDNADSFGGSNYMAGWQFDQSPDYDVFYEPEYLPYYGEYIPGEN